MRNCDEATGVSDGLISPFITGSEKTAGSTDYWREKKVPTGAGKQLETGTRVHEKNSTGDRRVGLKWI